MRLRSDLVGTHPKFSNALLSLGVTRSAFSQGTFVSLDAREGLGQNMRRLCFDLDWYSLKVFKHVVFLRMIMLASFSHRLHDMLGDLMYCIWFIHVFWIIES